MQRVRARWLCPAKENASVLAAPKRHDRFESDAFLVERQRDRQTTAGAAVICALVRILADVFCKQRS